VARLQVFLESETIVVGDLVLCEVLQGFRTEARAELARRIMHRADVMPMVGPEIALKAAENYRKLRRRGITIARTIDLLIGTFCIARGYALLHADRDFDPMAQYLGLRTF
jgi:predicted nucleic acid-binding protein